MTPGLPSELLLQRPDIRAAEAQLASADASVEAARAAFFPSISLTGQYGVTSTALKNLFTPQAIFYQIAANLAQPVFDGFRLEGQLEQAKGRQIELLNTYRKTDRLGLRRRRAGADRDRRHGRARAAAARGGRRARDAPSRSPRQRLREGTVDLVTVLQTQQTLFTGAGHSRRRSRFARLQAVLSLFQALGGSWLPPPPKGKLRTRNSMTRARTDSASPSSASCSWPASSTIGRRGSSRPQQQQQGKKGKGKRKKAAAPTPDEPVPVLAIDARTADVPVYLDGVGTAQGAQHRDGAPAGRRQADRDLLHGRPGRAQRLRARQDRSDHLSGAIRPGGGQEGAGRGHACQRQARPRALHQACRRPTRSTSSRSTPSARWSPSSKRRSSSTRPRSTMRARSSSYTDIIAPIAGPHRHPPGRRRQHRARLATPPASW